ADGDAALTDCILQLKKRGTTVVIISHRPSTIGVVDKLLGLREGVAEMFGPRVEIMSRLTRAVPVHAGQSTASQERDHELFGCYSSGHPRGRDPVRGKNSRR